MTKNKDMIEKLLDRMDTWRHLPSYQLERRADILFSLYLQQVLLEKIGTDISDFFVPEFPVRIGTIYPHISTDKSYKIDFVAVSKKGDIAYLIELKTDGSSRRDSQDKYLLAAQTVGMKALLEGVVKIFNATQAKRKYFHLLKQLENMGQIVIPTNMNEIILRKSLIGINEASKSIQIVTQVAKCKILYIQPKGEAENIISFREFAGIIENNNDSLSRRFSQSLREWAKITAGQQTSSNNSLKNI